MTDPNFIVLYVDDPQKSAAFYAGLLGAKEVESSPNFAGLAIGPSMLLGLWRRNQAKPAPIAQAGAAELGITLESRAAVDAAWSDWKKRGLTIAQDPIDLDFGHTFVALDPDGHRIRVMVPSQP